MAAHTGLVVPGRRRRGGRRHQVRLGGDAAAEGTREGHQASKPVHCLRLQTGPRPNSYAALSPSRAGEVTHRAQ